MKHMLLKTSEVVGFEFSGLRLRACDDKRDVA